MNTRAEVFAKFYEQDNIKRKAIHELTKQLQMEDKLHRSYAFWLFEVVYDKFFAHQDGVSRRLMF